MKALLSVIVGFVHDLATGCWAATVVAVWYLDRQVAGVEAGVVLAELEKGFFAAGLVCVGLVFATGAGRTFTYVPNFYGAEGEKQRRRLLIRKHVLLLIVFGSGTWWQYTMAFG